jgi:hypothetical protein
MSTPEIREAAELFLDRLWSWSQAAGKWCLSAALVVLFLVVQLLVTSLVVGLVWGFASAFRHYLFGW